MISTRWSIHQSRFREFSRPLHRIFKNWAHFLQNSWEDADICKSSSKIHRIFQNFSQDIFWQWYCKCRTWREQIYEKMRIFRKQLPHICENIGQKLKLSSRTDWPRDARRLSEVSEGIVAKKKAETFLIWKDDKIRYYFSRHEHMDAYVTKIWIQYLRQ